MGLTFLRVCGMNGASRDGSVWYCFGEIGEGTSRDG